MQNEKVYGTCSELESLLFNLHASLRGFAPVSTPVSSGIPAQEADHPALNRDNVVCRIYANDEESDEWRIVKGGEYWGTCFSGFQMFGSNKYQPACIVIGQERSYRSSHLVSSYLRAQPRRAWGERLFRSSCTRGVLWLHPSN